MRPALSAGCAARLEPQAGRVGEAHERTQRGYTIAAWRPLHDRWGRRRATLSLLQPAPHLVRPLVARAVRAHWRHPLESPLLPPAVAALLMDPAA